MIKKKVKVEEAEDKDHCTNCKLPLIISDGSKLCESCGKIYEENSIFIDEYNTDQKKFLSFHRPFWTTQKYDSNFTKDCTIRKYLVELAQKIEFPENMKTKTESLVKIILTDKPELSKSLKSICFLCAYLKLKIRDPAFSIRSFCEKFDMKPKNLLKHMPDISQYTYDTPRTIVKNQSEVENEEREYFSRTLENLNFDELLSKDAHFALSLFGNNPNLGKENPFDNSNEEKSIHAKIKAKIKTYGLILLENETLYPIKFGKKLDKFVASIIFLVCKFLDLPITMKKLSSIVNVSHIAISRMTKEISGKIVELYKDIKEQEKKTEEKIMIKNETDIKEDPKASKASSPEDSKDIDISIDFNKALKYLYKLDKKHNCIDNC